MLCINLLFYVVVVGIIATSAKMELHQNIKLLKVITGKANVQIVET